MDTDFEDKVYPSTPFETFVTWMDLAAKNELNDFNAMTLVTVGDDGMPSSRMQLLKGYDVSGFIFYSNYNSRKAKQIKKNPNAAMNFYWKTLRRQIMIEGTVIPLPEEESDAYFATRPRTTQIGAWASLQSQTMQNRDDLDDRIIALTTQYEGKDIPRPSFWGGFRLVPLRIEFWQDGPSRLHNRVVYYRPTPDDHWVKESLYP